MGSSIRRPAQHLVHTLALVSMVSAAALVCPSSANADWDGFRNYTYGSSSCSSGDIKDPLNYFFNTTIGRLGEEPVARVAIMGVVGWMSTPYATNQYMWSTNSGCHIQNHQQAETGVAWGKYHTRLRQGPWITGWGYATASPMHHDSLTWCGDVADSFNSARDYAKTKFSNAGYIQQAYYLGNTQSMQQCDGRYTASDGYAIENHGY
jgi:hypothetical protein